MKKVFFILFCLFFSVVMLAPTGAIAAGGSEDCVMADAAKEISKDPTVSGATTGAVFSVAMTAFLGIKEGCWFCPIFDTVYNTGNEIATNLNAPLRDIALALLALFGVGWIFIQVLKFITTLHAPNVGEFLTRMFKTLGLVLIMAAFLGPKVSFLTRNFVDIPALFALGLTDKILESNGFGGDTVEYTTYSISDCHLVSTTNKTLCEKTPENEDLAMSAALHDEILCLLKKVSVRLLKGMAMGVTFIVASFLPRPTILPDFSMFLVGVFVFLCYFSLFLKIPIYLVDCVLKLCFLVVTLPIFVMCYPFPSTRAYTKKAWEMLLSILVHVISLAVFVSLALNLIEEALK